MSSVVLLLDLNSFWGRANNGMVEPVVIGAQPNNKMIKNCLDVYLKKTGREDYQEIPLEILPIFKNAGFEKEKSETQHLEDATIYSYEHFCPLPFENADESDPKRFKTENTYAIHLWNAAWFDPFRFFWNSRRKKGWKTIGKIILSNPFQNKQFYKNVFYHLKCGIFGYPEC